MDTNKSLKEMDKKLDMVIEAAKIADLNSYYLKKEAIYINEINELRRQNTEINNEMDSLIEANIKLENNKAELLEEIKRLRDTNETLKKTMW